MPELVLPPPQAPVAVGGNQLGLLCGLAHRVAPCTRESARMQLGSCSLCTQLCLLSSALGPWAPVRALHLCTTTRMS